MKLHLPAFLRKAVLACLAALAMPLTLGSGAAFLSSGALVSFALSQRVMAADVTITNRAEWEAAVADSELNQAGKTWDLQYTNDDDQFYFPQKALTYAANLNLTGNVIVKNGYSSNGGPYTFSGNITGAAGVTFKYAGPPSGQNWIFTGDVSGFAGNFDIQGGNNFKLRFEGNRSNTGSISVSNATSALVVKGATMLNSSINTTNLTIENFGGNGSTFQVGEMTVNNGFSIAGSSVVTFGVNASTQSSTVNINSAASLGANAGLNIQSGVSVRLSSGLTAAAGSTLTLGGTLELTGGTLDVSAGTFSALEGSLIKLGKNARLSLAEGTDLTHLKVAVTDGPGVYQLFADGHVLPGFSKSNIDLGATRATSSYDAARGVLTINNDGSLNLTWNKGSFTWAADDTDTQWNRDDDSSTSHFVAGDSVTFDGTGTTGDVTVRVSDTVHVSSLEEGSAALTVVTDGDTNYTFTGGTINVTGGVDVSGCGKVRLEYVLAGCGDISVAQGTSFEIGSSSFSNWSTTGIYVSGEGRLIVDYGGTIVHGGTSIMKRILDGEENSTRELSELEFAAGTVLDAQTNEATVRRALAGVHDVYISDGAAYRVRAQVSLSYVARDGNVGGQGAITRRFDNTLHIAGQGTSTSNNAALSVEQGDNGYSRIDWNLELEDGAGDGATIFVTGNLEARVFGNFDANTYKLTKTGAGTLILNSMSGGTNAGDIAISAGTLKLTSAASSGLTAKTVDIANGATWAIEGAYTYVIEGLTGSGSVSSAAEAYTTLKINTTATVESSADISGVAKIVKDGTGTQSLTGEFTGAVDVQRGKLVLGGALERTLTSVSVSKGAELSVSNGLSASEDVTLNGKLTLQAGGLATGRNLAVGEGAVLDIQLSSGETAMVSAGSVDNGHLLRVVVHGILGEYQLFAQGIAGNFSIANIDISNINVDAGRGIVTAYDQTTGILTISGNNLNLSWEGGALTWSSGEDGSEWKDSALGEEAHFVAGDHVSLTGEGAVTIVGTVSPGSMTVDGTYTFSGGTLNTSSAIQVTGGTTTFTNTNITSDGVNISAGATVVLSDVTNKTLGGITVESGGTLKLTSRCSEADWHGGSVTGNGTLELATGQRWTVSDDSGDMMFWTLLSSTAGDTLGELKITGGTILDSQEGGTPEQKISWQNAKKITVESGSHWGVSSGNFRSLESWTLAHEYHIAGNGTGDAVSGATTAEKTSALSFDDKFGADSSNSYYLSGDLYLDADATVLVGGGDGAGAASSATVLGTFHAGTHALTKTGAGMLVLKSVEGEGKAGVMEVAAGTLKLSFDADYAGAVATTMEVKEGATLSLDGAHTYTVSTLSGSGSVTGANGASLTLVNNKVAGVEFSGTISGLATLTKDGGGKQTIHGISADNVAVVGGELVYAGGGEGFGVGSTTVGSGATLTLASSDGKLSSESGVTLGANATLKLATADVTLGTLTAEAGKSSITWAEGAKKLSVAALSGGGTLNAGDGELSIETVNDFTGTLNSTGKVSVGNIAVDSDGGHIAATAHVNGSLTKSGAGAFSIEHLVVDAESVLHMNYEGGALTLTKLTVADGATLAYAQNAKANEQVISVNLSDLYNTERISLDIWDADSTLLDNGLCLGIVKGDVDVAAADLQKLFNIARVQEDGSIENGSFELSWKDGLLYLTVTDYRKTDAVWDTHWGVSVAKTAPDATELEEHKLSKVDLGSLSTNNVDFTYNSLELSAEGSAYTDERSRSYVMLTDGPGLPGLASVFGGQVYYEGDAGKDVADSYIYLAPDEGKTVDYHLLVGGSACVSGSASEGAGFFGDSHIQVQGGTVDYIIGGNHVTNAAFTFEGNSYISVYEGSTVRGGIVGGSTITSGVGTVNEFDGDSRIFIYTVLSNVGNDVPTISDATHSDNGVDRGAAFTAVVGGNAWIDLPSGNSGAAPAFKGSSRIVVELNEEAEGQFDKAIVGGNYTAAFDGGADTARSTSFDGDAHVRIVAGEGVTFVGGISGAGRRDSAGSGSTNFTGNTLVEIGGGSHYEAIAGGFWFGEKAEGSHVSTLAGATEVAISGGNVWRAVGGSYSLGGSAGATDTHEGNSTVSISGGYVHASVHGGETDELSVAFVAGGNFYRGNEGGTHERKSGNTLVKISGSAELGSAEAGVHVVGGDYANFTGSGNTETSIDGNTGVSISGGRVNGLVLGGSYLYDESQGGSVRISGTASVSISGGEVTADPLTSNMHDHYGVAVVGGSMIVDETSVSGDHTASVGSTAVTVSGGVVDGNIVGGSYGNDSAGTNTLSVESTAVTISGGVVYGNIYGGHFSANAEKPDVLELDNAVVTLEGDARVKGNVVGGSYRLTTKAMSPSQAPKQVSAEVHLLGGTLDGHVYAAGWNNSPLSSALSATTGSTLVEISSDVKFEHLEGPGVSAMGEVIVSGGYYKGTSSEDQSTVTGTSSLVFSSPGSDYENIERLRFEEFDIVSVASGSSVSLGSGRFFAKDNFVKDNRSFTMEGAGSLSLAELKYKSAAGAVHNFAGKISVLGGGSLILGSDQSVDGGLAFDLSHGKNERSSAYLQTDGAHLVLGGSLSVAVEVSAEKGSLKVGTYYLADGFESENALDMLQLVTKDLDAYKLHLEMDGNCLVLMVGRNASTKWIWDGNEGGLWGADSSNWTYEGNDGSEGQNVIFDAGSSHENVGIVGKVKPGNINVEGGDYVFTQAQGKGGLEMTGTLTVGNEQTAEGDAEAASLTLGLANTKVPHVVLQDTGTLVLAHEGALNGVEDIAFNGGVLGYATDAEGKLLNKDDLSAKVAAGEGAIRIMVGGEVAAEGATVTWGSATAAANVGVRRILTDGIEKSGNADFTVAWAAANGEQVTGAANVTDGVLTYQVQAKENSTVSMSGDITVADGAAAVIAANGGKVAVSSVLSGAGTVTLGGTAAYTLDGDNTEFDGTLELSADKAGQSVQVQSTAALGGEHTTLALNGRDIVLQTTESEITAGTVQVAGVNHLGGAAPEGANTGITLVGNVVGAEDGVLTAAGKAAHTILGSVAGYTGALVAEGEQSAWQLGNMAESAPIDNGAVLGTKLAGKGSVTIAYQVGDDAQTEGTLQLGGAISDTVDVENATNATIILTGEGTSTGKLIATGAEVAARGEEIMPLSAEAEPTAPATANVGGSFRLGTATESGTWAGSVVEGSADKSFTLVNGTLTNGITTKGAVQLKVDTTETLGSLVNAGGTQGSLFDSIALAANSRLSGVTGDITATADTTEVSLQLGASNIDSGKGEAAAYLLGTKGGNLVAGDALSMDFSNDGFIALLKKHRAENAKSYAHVISGGELRFADPQVEGDLTSVFRDGSYAELLGGLSFHYIGVDGGDIMITGSSSEVYLVLPDGDDKGDSHTVNAYGVLDNYLATVVDSGETLSIEVGDDTRPAADGTERTENNLTVNNLVGLEGATLKLSRSKGTAKDVTVSLNNANVKVSDEFGLPEGVTPESLSCIDTEFEGSIVSDDAHVHINKMGPGTLTVGSKSGESGGLSLAGNLRLSGGRVVVRGAESQVGSIVFDYAAAADSALEEVRGYVVRGGESTVGSIAEQGADSSGNIILLENGGRLNLTAESTLEGTSISAVGGGLLNISGKGAQLALIGSSKLDGADVSLSSGGVLALDGESYMAAASVSLGAGGKLSVGGSSTHTATKLSGEGTLAGAGGTLELIGAANSFTGSFAGSATLVVGAAADLTLQAATMDTTAGRWNVTNQGSLVIDVADSNSDVKLGELTLAKDSTTRYLYNTDKVSSGDLLNLSALYIERGASLTIETKGVRAIQGTHLKLGSVAETTGTLTSVELEGAAFQHYTGTLRWKDGEIYLDLALRNENIYMHPNMEKNAAAGARLFWDATGPDGAWQSGVLENENSDLSRMVNSLEKLSKSGHGALDTALAAGAGASVATLGSAFAQDLQRQLSVIRTRTATMGADVAPTPGRYNYSMWLNGETDYHKLKADGLAPGYTLNGWGGTVGMNVDLAPGATVGLAVSAMYNDLKTSSADNGRGDLDTTYLSVFGRKAYGAWMHTLVLSGGVADVTLNRTVNYVMGNYSTKGSTDGYALGMMYEVGYSKVLRADGSFILQPVFNVQLRHAAVKGYTETGSDAGLRVDDISQNVVTFGLGARMQRIVGENLYNRAAVLEARALLKADAGNNAGKADTALINGAPRSAQVESAKVGPVGIEVGAGLSIPIGVKAGSLFMDASVELRKDYTTVDANVGYRINF